MTKRFAGCEEQMSSVSAITHFSHEIRCTRICTRIPLSKPTWNLPDRFGWRRCGTRHKSLYSLALPLSPQMLLLYLSLLRRRRKVRIRWNPPPQVPPEFRDRPEPRCRTGPAPTPWPPGKKYAKNVPIPEEPCDTRKRSGNAILPGGQLPSSRKALRSRAPIPDRRTARQHGRILRRYAAVP